MKSKKYKLSAIVFYSVIIVLALVLPNMALAAPMPDTGQTKCFNNTTEIPCPQQGQLFYGQDAQYGPNTHSYTKLDASGNDLFNDATTWLMVRDNVTGLIWEEKHNKDNVQNYTEPNDADNTYTWYDGTTGYPGNGTDTQDFINAAFTLISNPETLDAMRKNALERAKSFSWDNVFQKLFTSYQVCIESKKNNTRVSK